MTKSLREFLDLLYEEWDLASLYGSRPPRDDIDVAIQVTIGILVERLEEAHREMERSRNVGYSEGWEAARKFYREKGGAE